MPLKILKQAAAERDLLEIGHYTFERWGEEQADRYLREIDATIDQLRDFPLLGAGHGYVRKRYQKLNANHLTTDSRVSVAPYSTQSNPISR